MKLLEIYNKSQKEVTLKKLLGKLSKTEFTFAIRSKEASFIKIKPEYIVLTHPVNIEIIHLRLIFNHRFTLHDDDHVFTKKCKFICNIFGFEHFHINYSLDENRFNAKNHYGSDIKYKDLYHKLIYTCKTGEIYGDELSYFI